MTPSLGIEPRPYWWKASALTTNSALHPLQKRKKRARELLIVLCAKKKRQLQNKRVGMSLTGLWSGCTNSVMETYPGQKNHFMGLKTPFSVSLLFCACKTTRTETAYLMRKGNWFAPRKSIPDRLWADYGQNLSVLLWLRLRTVKTRNFRNGKISTKTHKNTPVQRWVSFIHFIEWTLNWAFFRLHNRRYLISHTKSSNAFKFSTAACNATLLALKGHLPASN